MIRKGFVFRLIGVLLLIGLVIGGGFMAYRAGVSQGIVQAPAVATAISKAAENGTGAPVPPMYGYGYGYGNPYRLWGPHFGFLPFSLCGSILFLFLFFGLLKMIFFRPWRMGWVHHGPWEHRPHDHPWGGPPWMRREHEKNEGDQKAENSPEEKQ